MGSYHATWEDEENNRHIQFSVDYTAENGSIEIQAVTPSQISFICPQTNTCHRAVGVHTKTGRSLLAKHLRAKADMDRLANEIARRTQETAAV